MRIFPSILLFNGLLCPLWHPLYHALSIHRRTFNTVALSTHFPPFIHLSGPLSLSPAIAYVSETPNARKPKDVSRKTLSESSFDAIFSFCYVRFCCFCLRIRSKGIYNAFPVATTRASGVRVQCVYLTRLHNVIFIEFTLFNASASPSPKKLVPGSVKVVSWKCNVTRVYPQSYLERSGKVFV